MHTLGRGKISPFVSTSPFSKAAAGIKGGRLNGNNVVQTLGKGGEREDLEREALQFNRPRFHVSGVCLCRIIFEIDGGREDSFPAGGCGRRKGGRANFKLMAKGGEEYVRTPRGRERANGRSCIGREGKRCLREFRKLKFPLLSSTLFHSHLFLLFVSI